MRGGKAELTDVNSIEGGFGGVNKIGSKHVGGAHNNELNVESCGEWIVCCWVNTGDGRSGGGGGGGGCSGGNNNGILFNGCKLNNGSSLQHPKLFNEQHKLFISNGHPPFLQQQQLRKHSLLSNKKLFAKKLLIKNTNINKLYKSKFFCIKYNNWLVQHCNITSVY